jgi:hypothetical protein
MTPENSGPVASETALFGVIAFKPDPTAHEWTKRKIAQATILLESGEMDYDNVATMMVCTADVVRTRLARQSEPNEG